MPKTYASGMAAPSTRSAPWRPPPALPFRRRGPHRWRRHPPVGCLGHRDRQAARGHSSVRARPAADSAISGAATSILAAERCERLAVIGSGKQAEGQISAVAAVRDVAASPSTALPRTPRRLRGRIAERSGSRHDPPARLPRRWIRLTSSSPSHVPPTLHRSSMLANRVHINAVGAITPERAELEPAVVARARDRRRRRPAARQLAPRELSAANAPHVVSLGPR